MPTSMFDLIIILIKTVEYAVGKLTGEPMGPASHHHTIEPHVGRQSDGVVWLNLPLQYSLAVTASVVLRHACFALGFHNFADVIRYLMIWLRDRLRREVWKRGNWLVLLRPSEACSLGS